MCTFRIQNGDNKEGLNPLSIWPEILTRGAEPPEPPSTTPLVSNWQMIVTLARLLSPFSTTQFFSHEPAKHDCDSMEMSSGSVASQSSFFFHCPHEKIRLVENRLYLGRDCSKLLITCKFSFIYRIPGVRNQMCESESRYTKTRHAKLGSCIVLVHPKSNPFKTKHAIQHILGYRKGRRNF
jgi:hypothetical protein